MAGAGAVVFVVSVFVWQVSQMPKPVSGPKPLAPVKLWKLTALPFITFLMSIMLFELCVVWQSRHSVAGSSLSVCFAPSWIFIEPD